MSGRKELFPAAPGGNRSCWRLFWSTALQGPGRAEGKDILGTMDERFLSVREFDLQSFHFGLFWKEVNQRLDGLALEPAVREELEHRIEEKICQTPCRLGPLAEKVFAGLPPEKPKSILNIQEQGRPLSRFIFFLLNFSPNILLKQENEKWEWSINVWRNDLQKGLRGVWAELFDPGQEGKNIANDVPARVMKNSDRRRSPQKEPRGKYKNPLGKAQSPDRLMVQRPGLSRRSPSTEAATRRPSSRFSRRLRRKEKPASREHLQPPIEEGKRSS